MNLIRQILHTALTPKQRQDLHSACSDYITHLTIHGDNIRDGEWKLEGVKFLQKLNSDAREIRKDKQ